LKGDFKDTRLHDIENGHTGKSQFLFEFKIMSERFFVEIFEEKHPKHSSCNHKHKRFQNKDQSFYEKDILIGVPCY